MAWRGSFDSVCRLVGWSVFAGVNRGCVVFPRVAGREWERCHGRWNAPGKWKTRICPRCARFPPVLPPRACACPSVFGRGGKEPESPQIGSRYGDRELMALESGSNVGGSPAKDPKQSLTVKRGSSHTDWIDEVSGETFASPRDLPPSRAKILSRPNSRNNAITAVKPLRQIFSPASQPADWMRAYSSAAADRVSRARRISGVNGRLFCSW